MKTDKIEYICLTTAWLLGMIIGIIAIIYVNKADKYEKKYKEYKEYYEIAMTKYETLQVNYDDLESDYQMKLYHLRKDCRGE